MEQKQYIYLHINGELIFKNFYTFGDDLELNESPFVKSWWFITSKRSMEIALNEAEKLGALPESLKKYRDILER